MFTQPFSIFRVRYYLLVLAFGAFFPAVSQAQLVVDCTGATLGTFSTINAALASSGPGTAIFVIAGPCHSLDQAACRSTAAFPAGSWKRR